jgi:acyl-CoA synthetase (NDP forming)
LILNQLIISLGYYVLSSFKRREPTRLALEEEGWPTFLEIHRTVKVMANLFENYGTKRDLLENSSPEFQIPPKIMKRGQPSDEKGRMILDELEAKKWFKALNLRVVKEVAAKNLERSFRPLKR